MDILAVMIMRRCGLARHGKDANDPAFPFPLMFLRLLNCPARLCLFMAALVPGLTSCNPSVSDIELKSANSKAEAAEARLAKLEGDIKVLMAEKKQLTTFSGPDHEKLRKRAESLRQEKSD